MLFQSIFRPNIVLELTEFYGDLLHAYDLYPSIKDHLEAIAIKHYDGVMQKVDCVFVEMNNYNPRFIGHSVDKLKANSYSLLDSKHTIGHEYGFNGWQEVAQLEREYSIVFEHAVNHLLSGNLKSLRKLIHDKPSLVTQRSAYGHRATLLHYCGSNGVEFWRQQVPMNLRDIIQFLLESGADKKATMSVYGGEFDTLSLLTTSAHPANAGIVDEVVGLL